MSDVIKKLDKEQVYYLASPYSHDNDHIREIRYQLVSYAASILNKQEFIVIEPIGMCHAQSLRYNMPTGYAFWQKRDRTFISISDAVLVLGIPGWDESVGVADEIEYAKSLGKPVIHIHPRDIFPEEVCDAYKFVRRGVIDAVHKTE